MSRRLCFPTEVSHRSHSPLSLLSPAAAREVCDEGCGGPLLGGVCGYKDEGFGQVPEASRGPPCSVFQPTS